MKNRLVFSVLAGIVIIAVLFVSGGCQTIPSPHAPGLYLVYSSRQIKYIPSVQTSDTYPGKTAAEIWEINKALAVAVPNGNFTLGVYPNYVGSNWVGPKVMKTDSSQFATVRFVAVEDWGRTRNAKPMAKFQVTLPSRGRYVVEDPANTTWGATYAGFIEW